MWLALVGLGLCARPMTVHIYPDEPGFEVHDGRGDPISAWHFAHWTRDRPRVSSLRTVVYARRFAVIGAMAGGGLGFLVGSTYLATEGRARFSRGLQVRGDVAAAGLVASGGLLMFASGIAIARHKPRSLQVDTHYTVDEAVGRIRAQGIVITPTGLGLQGTW